MDLNQLVLHYSKSNLVLDGIYRLTVPPGTKATEKTTSGGVCGFVFPIRGKAKFNICKNDYYLEAGTILHAGPKMELNKEVVGEEYWEYILVHYRVLDEEKGKESLLDMHYTLKIFSDQNREIIQLLEKLIKVQKNYSFMSSLTTKALLYEIISNVLDLSIEREEHKKKDSMDEVLNYIHNNLDKNLLIADLAEKYGMNGKQFYYLFQKKMGISPKRYIIETQLKRAKELILEDNYSISDVSVIVGYEDSLHFSRVFKQNIGMSPTSFRNQFRKNPY